VRDRIEREGGLSRRRVQRPAGENALLLAVLPIARIEPTPFQRDLVADSPQKLADVLDPPACSRPGDRGHGAEGGFLDAQRKASPRGDAPSRREIDHRARCPKREIAWQILALNTEKAHNLRERSLEVIRIYAGSWTEDAKRTESASLLPGRGLFRDARVCYEKNGSSPAARTTHRAAPQKFSEEPLSKAIKEHERHAEILMDLDERVAEVMPSSRRAFRQPYLRPSSLARINPLRWIRGIRRRLEEVLKTMRERARSSTPSGSSRKISPRRGAPDDASKASER